MIIAVLKYDVGNGQSGKFKVRPGQSVLIGASNSADIKLANTAGVAPQHCEVKFENGSFAIKNLTKRKQSVLVNGTKIESTNLHNSDCIEIGNNKLTVMLESDTTEPTSRETPSQVSSTVPVTEINREKSPTDTSHAPAVPASNQSPTAGTVENEPIFASHPNGVRSLELVSGSASGFMDLAHPIFEECGEHWDYGVLFNHLLSQIKSSGPGEGNLLEGLSEDITQSNDLYLETGEDKVAIWKLFSKYAENKAAVLCLMKKRAQPVDYPKESKELATWFFNPETLQFHIINGSDLLISKIFGLFDALVFADPENKQDLILLNDISVTDWTSFVSWIKGA